MRTEAQRFWQKINKNGDCWEWVGATNEFGYGIFSEKGGKLVRAHRYSYERFIGKIPNGKFVLHKCDNPSCVNPRHLFLGTAYTNMRDQINKGRRLLGERHPLSRLKNADVVAIRRMVGVSQYKIADIFGVTRESIRDIIKRKIWKHI